MTLRTAINALRHFDQLRWWEQLGVAGSIASLVGLAIIFVPSGAPPPHQAEQSAPELSWSESAAKALSEPLIAAHSWSEADLLCYKGCRPVTYYLGAYHVLVSGKRKIILAYYTMNEAGVCHACWVQLSFFEFGMSNSRWALDHAEIGGIKAGEFGRFQSDDLAIHQLGENTYGIAVTETTLSMGYFFTGLQLYARLEDGFHEVLTLNTDVGHWKDSGNTVVPGSDTMYSRLRFQRTTSGLYDIAVETHVLVAGMDTSRTTLYRFDGRRYLPVTVIQ
jgi:hypothetical protein